MAGTPLKNLRMFANLCGDGASRNVILSTTMWKRVKPEMGKRREDELKARYWKGMLDHGSRTFRFYDTSESAWDIIGTFLRNHSDALLLQEEMVDLHKRLNETSAGKTLYDTLQKLLADQQDAVRKLQGEAEHQENAQLVQELQYEYERIQEQLRITFEQIEEIKIPLSRRIRMLFSFKKSRAV
jgi:hypothetical protein